MVKMNKNKKPFHEKKDPCANTERHVGGRVMRGGKARKQKKDQGGEQEAKARWYQPSMAKPGGGSARHK